MLTDAFAVATTDAVVVLEDDVIAAPDFVRFLADGAAVAATDASVFGVSVRVAAVCC
jgi:hypothetical protein